MKIKIKKNAAEIYRLSCYHRASPSTGTFIQQYYMALDAIAGQIIEIETRYLFADQFNTVSIKGVSDSGLRIHANLVDKVIDDARLYKYKNGWDNTIIDDPAKAPTEQRKYIYQFVPIPHPKFRKRGEPFLMEKYITN